MSSVVPTDEDCLMLAENAIADPADWIHEVLGCRLWSKQKEIVEAVRDNKHTAVKSSHGIGKDYTAARVAIWFIYNHKPSIVITTGPTLRQVKGILWKEIAVAHRRARWHLRGQVLQLELKLDTDWRAWGFTAADYDPDRFQGFHEENVLVIIDEASGVSKSIYTAIDGILTSANAKLLEIGNPTDPSGNFASSFKKPRVKKISISAFQTPNFRKYGITEEDIRTGKWRKKITGKLPYPKLVTPEWVAEKYEDWGPENPLYRSRVLAEFPAEGVDTLIPLSWIEAAQQRELEPSEPIELGVDVATEGDDFCVVTLRRGPVARRLHRFGKSDTMATTGHVVKALEDTGASMAKVDVIGVGAGVVHRLGELGKPVAAANAGKNANDKEHYANQRAEWYWNLRKLFEDGDIDLDPKDEELAAQLAVIKWKPDSRGRIQIQKKADMKKELGHSPDDADALAIAYARVGLFSFSFGVDEEAADMPDVTVEAFRAMVNGMDPGKVSMETQQQMDALKRKQTPEGATDLLVKANKAKALHNALQDALAGDKRVRLVFVLGVGRKGPPTMVDGCFVVRVLGDASVVARVIEAHGYGEVVDNRMAPEKQESVSAPGGNLIDEDLMGELDGGQGPLMDAPVIRGLEEEW